MPLAVIAIVTAAASVVSSERARKATNKAAKADAKHAAVSNRQERIKALAKQRVVSSQQASAAEAGGVSGGSGAEGAIGSSKSATFSNIGIQQQKNSINESKNKHLNKAANFKSFASSFSTVSSVASFAGGGSGDAFADAGKMIKDKKFGYDT